MVLIGCDYHPSVQQIAMVDTKTGDYSEHRLGLPPRVRQTIKTLLTG